MSLDNIPGHVDFIDNNNKLTPYPSISSFGIRLSLLRYFDDFTNLSYKQNFVSFYVLFIQSFISFKFLIKTRSQHVENAKTQSIKALLEYKGRVRKNCLWERVLSVFYISEFLSPFMQTFMLLT